MKRQKSTLFRPVREEKGATAVEYALLASLIAAVVVGSVWTLGQETLTCFDAIVGAW